MNAWKIPFVIGIRTSGQNPLKTSSSRQLKHPVFYALQPLSLKRQHEAQRICRTGLVLKQRIRVQIDFRYSKSCIRSV